MNKDNQEIVMMHTADWHLRDSQYGRIIRAEDFFNAGKQVIEIARENAVDFIINGGDTLHVNRNTGGVMEMLFELDDMLRRAKIPMYTVTGNHDVSKPSFLTFPGFQRRRGNSDESSGIVCIDNRTIVAPGGVVVSGFPAVTKDNLLSGIAELQQKPDVLVWHGAVQEFVGFEMQNSLKLEEIPLGVAKAFLLGDIHIPGIRRLADGTLVAYPGPIELCDRGEPATKKVDIYTFTLQNLREKGLNDPVSLLLNTRPVIFLQVVEEAQIDGAIATIRRVTAEGDGRAPMVFMRYSSSVPGAVTRIGMSLDLSKSIFRAAVMPANFEKSQTFGAVADGQGTLAEDSLMFGRTDPSNRKKVLAGMIQSAVDNVIPPGSPLNHLAHELVSPTTNHRLTITQFIDESIAEPNVV